jgi:hypothetical protein
MCWGGAGFEPRTTDLQSGALPLSHLSSLEEERWLNKEERWLNLRRIAEPIYPTWVEETPARLQNNPLRLQIAFIT